MIMNALYSRKYSLLTKKSFKVAALTSTIILAAIVLYFFNPSDSQIYPPSPFRLLTGLYCPGCGTLRGLHYLLHGNLLKAFDLNPLMVISLPYLIYSYIAYSAPVIFGQKIPQIFIKSNWIWMILKVILAYWVLRNLPFAPFSWLAP
ncbi:DUF2752 domain-containing protein [Fischerella sp. FACHB-380]|nr:DUF2752 domain-containing protein [Fischerella sp. FACHB-380]